MERNSFPGRGFFWILVGSFFLLVFPVNAEVREALSKDAAGRKPEIWVTNPWLSYMVAFIGGDAVEVSSLCDWKGEMLRREDALPPRCTLVGLEERELQGVSLGYETGRVRYLFTSMPYLRGAANPRYLDPPTMSLLGQRILILLSSLFPEHHLYFQRNLAEFESRIESTVDMGREMLRPLGLVNFSGCYALWLIAAASLEVRPSPENLEKIFLEENLLLLEQTLDQSIKKGHVIVTDTSMSPEMQECILAQRNGVVLELPPLEERPKDFFLFLYEQYLTISNRYNQMHGDNIH